MNAMIWLILFVVLVVFEIATMGLTTIWFAAGALIAFFASLLHATCGGSSSYSLLWFR